MNNDKLWQDRNTRATMIVAVVLITVVLTILLLFGIILLTKFSKYGSCKNEVKAINKEVKQFGKDCKADGGIPP